MNTIPTWRRRGALQACAALVLIPPGVGVRACEFPTPNFTVIHPWTRATRPGQTSAIVSMGFAAVSRADRLIGADTPVAEGAELGGAPQGPALDFEIPEGRPSELAEHGVHLRLTDLRGPLEVARSYPMTLVFAQAGELRVLLNVDFARFA